jgi:hypothetical protein
MDSFTNFNLLFDADDFNKRRTRIVISVITIGNNASFLNVTGFILSKMCHDCAVSKSKPHRITSLNAPLKFPRSIRVFQTAIKNIFIKTSPCDGWLVASRGAKANTNL